MLKEIRGQSRNPSTVSSAAIYLSALALDNETGMRGNVDLRDIATVTRVYAQKLVADGVIDENDSWKVCISHSTIMEAYRDVLKTIGFQKELTGRYQKGMGSVPRKEIAEFIRENTALT